MTEKQKCFSLVPHIPRYDHTTRYHVVYIITNSVTILGCTVNYQVFSQEDNASTGKAWNKRIETFLHN